MRLHHLVLGLILSLTLNGCNEAGFSGDAKGKTSGDGTGGAGDGSGTPGGSNVDISTGATNDGSGGSGGGGDGSGGPGGGDGGGTDGGDGGGTDGGAGGGPGGGSNMCTLDSKMNVAESLALAAPPSVDCYAAGNLYYFDPNGNRSNDKCESISKPTTYGCSWDKIRDGFKAYPNFIKLIDEAQAENAQILACGDAAGFSIVQWARPPQNNESDCKQTIKWYIQTVCGGVENSPTAPYYCENN